MSQNFYFNGNNHKRTFVLTAVVAETKSDYWHSINRVLDERPIEEICSILVNHWSDPQKAIKLLKNGDVLHLGKTLKECEFQGESRQRNIFPNFFDIEKFNVHDPDDWVIGQNKIQFIEFRHLRYWHSRLLGDLSLIENIQSEFVQPVQQFKEMNQIDLF